MAYTKNIKVKTEEGVKDLDIGASASFVEVQFESSEVEGETVMYSLQEAIDKKLIGGGVFWNDGGEF